MTCKFKVGDKVRCIDATGFADGRLFSGSVYEVLEVRSDGWDIRVQEDGRGFDTDRFELVESSVSSASSEQFAVGQEVLAAIGITRNLKRATITNVSAGKDNQGKNLVGICVDSMDVIVPGDKLFVVP